MGKKAQDADNLISSSVAPWSGWNQYKPRKLIRCFFLKKKWRNRNLGFVGSIRQETRIWKTKKSKKEAWCIAKSMYVFNTNLEVVWKFENIEMFRKNNDFYSFLPYYEKKENTKDNVLLYPSIPIIRNSYILNLLMGWILNHKYESFLSKLTQNSNEITLTMVLKIDIF